MKQKCCTKCGAIKPLNEYKKDKRAGDGRRSECAECTRAYTRQWRQRNIDKARKYQREWQRANRNKTRKYSLDWFAKNPGYATAQSRRYRARHPEKAKAAAHKHFVNNRKAYYLREHAYRARKKNNTVEPINYETWQTIVARNDSRCVYCGERFESLTMDHVIPISNGGAHSIENIVPACLDCNRKKAARTPEEAGMPFTIEPQHF